MLIISSWLITTSRCLCNKAIPFNRSSDILDLIYVLTFFNDDKLRFAIAFVVGNMIGICSSIYKFRKTVTTIKSFCK